MRPSARIVHFPAPVDANPYTRLLYGGLSRFGFELEPDPRFTLSWLRRHRRRVAFLHFHWEPNEFYEWRRRPAHLRRQLSWLSLAWFAARLALARLLGYRIVWTIHEVRPHGSLCPRLDRAGARALVRSSHVLLAHHPSTAERLQREVRTRASVHVVPHGSYVGFYPPGRAPAEVRAELRIPTNAFVFLCFGTLKPYKRLDLLLAAFHTLEHPSVRLIVAGYCRRWERMVAEAVAEAAARDRRIKPLLEHVPDERVAELYDAADAAVLARADGGTSGSLILALSQGCPVVAPRSSAYEALTGGEEAAWLFEPGDARSLRDALASAAADPALAREKRAAALERAGRLRWDDACARTARLLLACR